MSFVDWRAVAGAVESGVACDAIPARARVWLAVVLMSAEQSDSITPRAIAARCNLPLRTTNNHLKTLRSDGVLVSRGGIYATASAPHAARALPAAAPIARQVEDVRTGVCVDLRRPHNETPEHWRGKLDAAAYLSRRGYPVIGFEVFMGLWVVDVVGVKPHPSGSEVFAIEVKGHRGDWRGELRSIRQQREARAQMEAFGPMPDMVRPRAGESQDAFRTRQVERLSQCAARRRVFSKAAKSAKLLCADLERMTTQRAVWAPSGVVDRSELVNGWGLIEDGRQVVKPARSGIGYIQALKAADVIARRYTLRVLGAPCYERRSGKVWPKTDEAQS